MSLMWMKSIGILCFPPPFWRDPHIIYPSQLPPTMQSENELMRRIILMRYVQCTYIIFKEQLLNKLYNWNHLLRRWWCETLAFCSIFFLLHNFIIKLGYLIMVNLNILCSLYDTTIVLIPIHNQLFMKSVSTRALQFQYNY